MGILIKKISTGDQTHYLENAIKYIFNKEDDPFSLCIGSPNMYLSSVTDGDCFSYVFNRMKYVKKYFGKESGTPLFHFIISYDFNYVNSEQLARDYSWYISNYFKYEYLTLFALHADSNKNKKSSRITSVYHSHLIIDSVNFRTGKKYPDREEDTYRFLEYIKAVTKDPYWAVENKIRTFKDYY